MKYQEWLFRKQSHYVCFWIIISFILIFVFCFLTCFSYYPYYQVTGIYRKEENYVSVLFENTKFETLENVEIKVENIFVQQKDMIIIDYVVVENKIYKQANIYLQETLDKQLVTVLIKYPKTTLWKKIWKGMIKEC